MRMPKKNMCMMKSYKIKKCLKDLYDNDFKPPKDVGDDNLKHHLINEFTEAKLHKGNDVGRLLIILKFESKP
jgi:hypothetical protein